MFGNIVMLVFGLSIIGLSIYLVYRQFSQNDFVKLKAV